VLVRDIVLMFVTDTTTIVLKEKLFDDD